MILTDELLSARDTLTETEAAERARRVSDVSYELTLDLQAGRDEYDGRTIARFAVSDRSTPLFLNFTGGVTELIVNGVTVTPDHRDHRLWLAPEQLASRMVLEIGYHNAYDHSGSGFHRFVDPEDGAEYIHSDFEPFSAHRLFPCFDQPDLKATYTLSVTAPSAWEVVSATLATASAPADDGRTRHDFPVSERFSTYLFAVVCGPYAVARTVHDGIPMGIFARRSMATILEAEADELFEITQQGFDLYRQLFGQQYPFGKYDQLFVPEFNAGAMENVAAVTFHDGFLFRDPPTETQRLERAEVVLHELAHMWFGNLVTLRWWNDLWLNESFATWASFHALERATRFSDAWTRFNGVMKPAAYRDDQRVTSHPIAMPVPDTDAAQTNFDAIVYEKGASVLRQLMATIGEDAFADGLETYFGRFAWGNATLSDFLGSLGAAAGRSLETWADGWIRTKGTDTVEATWREADGRIADLAIAITPSEPGVAPRSHAMHVGLLDGEDGATLRVTTIQVLAEGPRTPVPDADGLPVPALVFPNFGDFDYARVLLDDRSVRFALSATGSVADASLRQLLWSTLWDMVREGRLGSLDHLDAVVRMLPGETDLEIADSVLEQAIGGLSSYVPEERRAEQAAAFIDRAITLVEAAPAPDLARTWLRAAAAAASDAIGTPALDRYLDLIDHAPETVPVDQDLRWSAAITASAAGRADAAERIETESARDRSDRGVRARITAEVARPDAGSKAAAWERLTGEGWGSFQLTRAAMRGFQWPNQRELLEPYREPFFGTVRPTFARKEYAYARAWLRFLYPGLWAEPAMVERARTLLGELDAGEAVLARHLRETIDDQERMIRVRARALRAG